MSSKPSSSVSSSSDVVNYMSRPSAPLIIPIVFFVVLGALIVCIVVKFLLRLWDRHHKSDSYKFVDAEEAKLNLTFDEKNSKSDPKLSSLVFVSDKKKTNNNDDSSNENGSVTIEANVHDSSNETNETELVNDDSDNNAVGSQSSDTDYIPLTSNGTNAQPFPKATESDV